MLKKKKFDVNIIYICNLTFLIKLELCEVNMTVSYNGLWKILIDNNMKKVDLIKTAGISSSTLAKMGKGEPVSLEVLGRICKKLNCDFGDLISYTRE